MAIGGSITLTTQAVARYIPSMTKPESHHGAPMAAAPDLSTGTVQSMSRRGQQARRHVGAGDGQPEHTGEHGDHQRHAPQPAGHQSVDRAVEVEAAPDPGAGHGAVGDAGRLGVERLPSATGGSRCRPASAVATPARRRRRRPRDQAPWRWTRPPDRCCLMQLAQLAATAARLGCARRRRAAAGRPRRHWAAGDRGRAPPRSPGSPRAAIRPNARRPRCGVPAAAPLATSAIACISSGSPSP